MYLSITKTKYSINKVYIEKIGIVSLQFEKKKFVNASMLALHSHGNTLMFLLGMENVVLVTFRDTLAIYMNVSV